MNQSEQHIDLPEVPLPPDPPVEGDPLAEEGVARLVIQIMEANAAQAARMDMAEATLAAVRDRVEEMLTGPWMPTPEVLLSALHPSDEQIKRHQRLRNG